MAVIIQGAHLTPTQRDEALRMFVHRRSCEYAAAVSFCPNCRDFWSRCLGKCSTPWAKTDREWIERAMFQVTRKGRVKKVWTFVDTEEGRS